MVVAAALATGCTSHGTGTASATSGAAGTVPSPSATAADPDDMALPIDAYALTTVQTGEISQARDILMGECMRQFGFTYNASADKEHVKASAANQTLDLGVHGNKRRYGVIDMMIAERYGYHLIATVGQPVSASPLDKKTADVHGLGVLTPAKNAVLFGTDDQGKPVTTPVNGRPVPKSGCIGQADSQLSSTGQINGSPLVAQIRADSFHRSLADAKVTAAFAAWSACMKARGYNYPDPTEAGTDVNIDGPTVSPREMAIAEADVACKDQAKVVDVWSAFEINYQKGQIDQHFQELAQVQKANDAEMKAVEEIIGRG